MFMGDPQSITLSVLVCGGPSAARYALGLDAAHLPALYRVSSAKLRPATTPIPIRFNLIARRLLHCA